MAQSISDMSVTWPDGSTYNGIKLNVNDAGPSSASSLLMDLQVGSASQFNVNKLGQLVVGSGTVSPRITFGSTVGAVSGNNTNGVSLVWSNDRFTMDGEGVKLFSNVRGIVGLAVDDANTLAQRNGANAQTFRLYNTYTDASNYERAKFAWESNALVVGTEVAGSGTARNVTIVSGSTIGFQRSGITNPPTFRHRASNILDVYLGAAAYYSFNTSVAFQLDSGMQFAWGSGRSDTTADTGLARSAAGVVKVTNGSTGDGSLTASTFTATSSPVNTSAIAATGFSLTGTSAVSMVDLEGTWNTTGTPTGIKLNVTDTASNAASLLLDLGTGGGSFSSKFNVAKTGTVTLADAANLVVGTTTGTKLGTATSQKLGFWNAAPIVQPTTAVAAATTASTGTGDVVAASTTFDGYTIPQVVKALRNAGLLA